MGQVGQGLADHGRPEVRTTDAQGYHRVDGRPGSPDHFPGADASGQVGHALQVLVNSRHHVCAVHLDGRIPGGSQGGVEGRSALRGVHRLAGEHAFHKPAHLPFGGQVDQQVHRGCGQWLAGQVEAEVGHLHGQQVDPVGVADQFPQVSAGQVVAVGGQSGPGG